VRFNLTAIDDPAEIDRRLILDALLMLPAIDAATAGIETSRLIDVGSGAGFPGLALKIARPDLFVTLVEATGKKVGFLRTCIEELDLVGVEARHARAEDLGHDPAYRGRFDLATARAVAALPTLLELCMPFVRSGGRAFFPKGLNLAEELEAGRRAAPLVGARLTGAEILPGGQTTLVVAEKVAPTPARVPRRSGLPSREPLGVVPARPETTRRAPSEARPVLPNRGERSPVRGGRMAP
jgi:16S rRNA (guanine527-N7)-methyltransferase